VLLITKTKLELSLVLRDEGRTISDFRVEGEKLTFTIVEGGKIEFVFFY
jgi:hypothetical protein